MQQGSNRQEGKRGIKRTGSSERRRSTASAAGAAAVKLDDLELSAAVAVAADTAVCARRTSVRDATAFAVVGVIMLTRSLSERPRSLFCKKKLSS